MCSRVTDALKLNWTVSILESTFLAATICEYFALRALEVTIKVIFMKQFKYVHIVFHKCPLPSIYVVCTSLSAISVGQLFQKILAKYQTRK